MSDVGHKSLIKPLFNKGFMASALLATSFVLSVPSLAAAQEGKSATESTVSAQTSTPVSTGLQFNLPTNTSNSEILGENLNLPATDLGVGLGSSLNLPAEAIGSSVFSLDVLDTACITGLGSCVTGGSRADLGLTTLISTSRESKLGLSLRPRAALRVTDDGSSARLGGVVEFSAKAHAGEGLDNNTWYFFAGADAESVNYTNNNASSLTRDGFTLQDRVFVGDAKAGLGYRVGGADLSLSYQRREATSDEFTYKEDAAALSFTWKR